MCPDVFEMSASWSGILPNNARSSFGSYALNEDDFPKVLDEALRVAAEALRVPLTKVLEFAETAEHLVLRAGIGWAEGRGRSKPRGVQLLHRLRDAPHLRVRLASRGTCTMGIRSPASMCRVVF